MTFFLPLWYFRLFASFEKVCCYCYQTRAPISLRHLSLSLSPSHLNLAVVRFRLKSLQNICAIIRRVIICGINRLMSCFCFFDIFSRWLFLGVLFSRWWGRRTSKYHERKSEMIVVRCWMTICGNSEERPCYLSHLHLHVLRCVWQKWWGVLTFVQMNNSWNWSRETSVSSPTSCFFKNSWQLMWISGWESELRFWIVILTSLNTRVFITAVCFSVYSIVTDGFLWSTSKCQKCLWVCFSVVYRFLNC